MAAENDKTQTEAENTASGKTRPAGPPKSFRSGETVQARVPGPDGSGAIRLALKVKDRIGRYTVVAPIGEGAFGQVFEAFDENLKRRVALKILTRSHKGTHVRRFQREGEALAALAHPNVVAVFDVLEHPGGIVLAMEYVDGQNLTQWSEKRSWREIMSAFLQAARGLSAAHNAGLVHRDFKPDNVLVGADGRVRVADFGLATRADGTLPDSDEPAMMLDVKLSIEGQVVGSPYFMAPEVRAGGKASPSSDQYSFFKSMQLVLENKQRGVGEELVPPWVDAMIERGLGLSVAERWADLGAVVKELESRLGIAAELDPFRSLAIRRNSLLAIMLASITIYGASYIRGGGVQTPAVAFGIGLFFFGLLGAVGIVGRRELARSLTARRITALIAVAQLAFVTNRGLAWYWGTPPEQTATIDTLIVGVTCLEGMLFVHRWLLGPSVVCFVGVLGCALFPHYARLIFTFCVAAALGQGVWRLRNPDQDKPGYLSSEAQN